MCSQSPNKALIKNDFSAPYLIVGEAPGRADSELGEPFTGAPGGNTTGSLLYDALESVCHHEGLSLQRTDFAATNIVACVPYEVPEERRGFRPPTIEEANNCRARLVLTLQMWAEAGPAVGIIQVGKTAGRFLPAAVKLAWPKKKDQPPMCKVTHPSYWLRTGGINGHNAVEAKELLGDFLHGTWNG